MGPRVCDDGNALTGAGDNASGVGVMLEVTEVLADYKTHGTIIFVAFGAEEWGLWGSEYYAAQMSEEDIANTVTMIDLDSMTLSSVVTSNEPEDGLGDGDQSPDWTEPVIDQDSGIIIFQLRAERSGSGDGRIYTITIAATDEYSNSIVSVLL